ncbi:MAG: NTP transferase domain-containing protein [Candidatus Brocadiae bacterium]|nr:NTP transferase domain-containing protein [Candidatus Brocadiia bacterium]
MNADITKKQMLRLVNPKEAIVVVLGGGRGTRLHPLTRDRAKPAVGFGGKYRLIDVTLTNCLRSRFERIFILTQFNSFSLNRHIWQTYSHEVRSGGFIEVMAAEQTLESRDWFQGTADAVRQSLRHVLQHESRQVLILSADQIYHMDYRELLLWHENHEADCTIAAHYTAPDDITHLGVVNPDRDLRVKGFHEKPDSPDLVSHCRLDRLDGVHCPDGRPFLCSMGIYLFDTEVLVEALASEGEDFGRQVIPWTAEHKKLTCFPFDGYWEDVGTIEAFFHANMVWREGRGIAQAFKGGDSIITHARQLAPSRIHATHVCDSIIADGCEIYADSVQRSIIGVRCRIGGGCVIEDTIFMGNDGPARDAPFEIGANCRIRNAIIDKNVCIGEGSVIANEEGVTEADHDHYAIRSGIVVIPRHVTLPPGTRI